MEKIIKAIYFVLIKLFWWIRPVWATRLFERYLRRKGVNFKGKPRYISAKVWFDSSDYSLITLGEGITISSNVRILNHDWALDTVHLAFTNIPENYRPIGKVTTIEIGDHSFIGTGSILMPGCKIGKSVIIGAGTVVRGEIPDFSIVIGNPGKVIGDSRDYFKKIYDKITKQ